MTTRTVKEGNAFYELDEDCLKEKNEMYRKKRGGSKAGKENRRSGTNNSDRKGH